MKHIAGWQLQEVPARDRRRRPSPRGSGRAISRIVGGVDEVVVPVGTRLELTKVYEKGHAEVRPVEGDFLAWTQPRRQRLGPNEPVADTAEYRLGWITPDDDGRLVERDA